MGERSSKNWTRLQTCMGVSAFSSCMLTQGFTKHIMLECTCMTQHQFSSTCMSTCMLQSREIHTIDPYMSHIVCEHKCLHLCRPTPQHIYIYIYICIATQAQAQNGNRVEHLAAVCMDACMGHACVKELQLGYSHPAFQQIPPSLLLLSICLHSCMHTCMHGCVCMHMNLHNFEKHIAL